MERDTAVAHYFMDMAEREIGDCFRRLFDHDDDAMNTAADAALKFSGTLPNQDYVIPERSPTAAGTGRTPDRSAIKQFPGGSATVP